MSATLKKWEKAILGSLSAILLTWSGWALSNTFVRNQCNQRINELGARVDVVQGEQERRRAGVESIPLISQKVTSIEATVNEIARDTKVNGERLARVEGLLSKQVATSQRGDE